MLNRFTPKAKKYFPKRRGDAGDAELMVRVGKGCRDSWVVLFHKYAALAFKVAMRIVEDRGEAEETVQEVFLGLFRAQDQFDSRKGSFRVWLLQYAYSRALDQRRKLQSSRFYDLKSLDNPEDDNVVEESRHVLDLTPQETTRLRNELFSRLNGPERKVCELRLIEGLTMEEVARATGKPHSVVRRYFDAGRAKLRALWMEKSK
jgi:RNA polymerase sigma-70 factor (ECF subfamily)